MRGSFVLFRPVWREPTPRTFEEALYRLLMTPLIWLVMKRFKMLLDDMASKGNIFKVRKENRDHYVRFEEA